MNLVICSLLAFAAVSWDTDAKSDPTWVLFPVDTAVQKEVVRRNVDAYLRLDGNKFLENPTASFLESPGLQEQLKEIVARGGDSIIFYIHYCNLSVQSDRFDDLSKITEGVLKKIGYQKIGPGNTYTGTSFQEVLELASRCRKNDQPDLEKSYNSRWVRILSLSSALSRFLSKGASCVIEVHQSVDERNQGFSSETLAAIQNGFRELKFAERNKILFRLSSTQGGRQYVEQLYSGNPRPINELAKELGFQSGTISHTPCSGSPELLVGEPAPDFTLPYAGDEKRALYSQIQGKVCVLSFWGVACGPCRVEAPFLTTLHEKFADKGLVVIAVNAYDESEETVEAFMTKRSLSHPVALAGGEVSKQYKVGAYPTTFIIDRTGNVVSYEVGFENVFRPWIKQRIEQLLGKAD